MVTVDDLDFSLSQETIRYNFLVTKDGRMVLTPETAESDLTVYEKQRKLGLKEIVEIPQKEYETLKEEFLKQITGEEEIEEEAEAEEDVDDSTVGLRLSAIIERAVREGASDIHVVPKKKSGVVKFRIAGVVEDAEKLSRTMTERLVTKIKERAGMDTGDSTRPQDGKMKVKVDGREIEIRVSTLPLKIGMEDAVLRIQDSARILQINLEELGFEPEDLERYIKIAFSPYGAVVDVGGTGQGKSTTLYQTIIRMAEEYRKRREEKVILTVEDPVEVDLTNWGVRQVEVNPQRNVTFASALRAFLRHDPDVIMVGEIRDSETAKTAVQASLTGHMVFSTLHANDSVTAIDRLKELEVSPFLIANSFLAFLSQRLVRKLCPACRKKVKIPEEVKKQFNIDFDYYYVAGEGCEKCRNGFSGRTAVFELLEIDEEIKRLISSGVSTVEIKKHLRDRNWRNLWINGLRKVERGETSLEELLRVIQPDPIINAVYVEGAESQPDVGVVLYPAKKVEIRVDDKRGYVFDVSKKGLSVIFDEITFLELNRRYRSLIKRGEEMQEITFIPKSYKKMETGRESQKFIVGGTYTGDLSWLIS